MDLSTSQIQLRLHSPVTRPGAFKWVFPGTISGLAAAVGKSARAANFPFKKQTEYLGCAPALPTTAKEHNFWDKQRSLGCPRCPQPPARSRTALACSLSHAVGALQSQAAPHADPRSLAAPDEPAKSWAPALAKFPFQPSANINIGTLREIPYGDGQTLAVLPCFIFLLLTETIASSVRQQQWAGVQINS